MVVDHDQYLVVPSFLLDSLSFAIDCYPSPVWCISRLTVY